MRRTALARRFSPWIDIVRDLLAASHDFPRQLLLHELAASFGTRAAWAWGDPDGSFGFEMTQPIFGWPSSDCLDLWRHGGAARHPLVVWFAATGDPAAMSAARVPAGMVPGQAVDQVRELGVHPELVQQLAMPCLLEAATYRTFVLTRPDPDFGQEDLALARRLQPLVALLHRQCAVLAEATQDLGAADLTERQLAVLHLLSEGATAAAIGRRLGISPRTVHVHLSNVYRKLGVTDRVMAVRAYQELRLATPADGHRFGRDVLGVYSLSAAV